MKQRKRTPLKVRVRTPILPEPTSYTREDRIYQDHMASQIYKMALAGCTHAEMAEYFGVSREEFTRWAKEKHEVANALVQGGRIADAQVAKAMHKRATGYMREKAKIIAKNDGTIVLVPYKEEEPANVQAAMFWLTNRDPANWRKTPDPTQGALPPSMQAPPVNILPVRVKEPKTIEGTFTDVKEEDELI